MTFSGRREGTGAGVMPASAVILHAEVDSNCTIQTVISHRRVSIQSNINMEADSLMNFMVHQSVNGSSSSMP